MRKPFLAFLACLVVLASGGLSGAQEPYPARQVKIVVPFPPASPIDLIARTVSERLSKEWGRAVYVENRPGATGSLGVGFAAKSPADGYTLLFTVDFTLTMYPAVAKHLTYDPVNDFQPIATIGRTQNGVFVNAALGINTIGELVARAKAKPRELSFSTSGIASPSHLATELFSAAAGIEMLHVPYRGGPPALLGAVTGEVSLHMGPIPQSIDQVRAGKLKALAVTGTEESPLMPGVKPLVEQGFPGLVVTAWFAVLVPSGTPDFITSKVRDSLRSIMAEPVVRTRLTAVGIDSAWVEAEETRRAIQVDLKRWTEVARRLGLESGSNSLHED